MVLVAASRSPRGHIVTRFTWRKLFRWRCGIVLLVRMAPARKKLPGGGVTPQCRGQCNVPVSASRAWPRALRCGCCPEGIEAEQLRLYFLSSTRQTHRLFGKIADVSPPAGVPRVSPFTPSRETELKGIRLRPWNAKVFPPLRRT